RNASKGPNESAPRGGVGRGWGGTAPQDLSRSLSSRWPGPTAREGMTNFHRSDTNSRRQTKAILHHRQQPIPIPLDRADQAARQAAPHQGDVLLQQSRKGRAVHSRVGV